MEKTDDAVWDKYTNALALALELETYSYSVGDQRLINELEENNLHKLDHLDDDMMNN